MKLEELTHEQFVAWQIAKHKEFAQMSFEELEKLCDDYLGSKNSYENKLYGIIINVLHYDKFDEFQKAYPKIRFGKVIPPYFRDNVSNNIQTPIPKVKEIKQLNLFEGDYVNNGNKTE